MSEFIRGLGYIQKSEAIERVQRRFYSLNETMVKLNVGLARE
jgi:hypothetical protein